jgi:hypothetical protein
VRQQLRGNLVDKIGAVEKRIGYLRGLFSFPNVANGVKLCFPANAEKRFLQLDRCWHSFQDIEMQRQQEGGLLKTLRTLKDTQRHQLEVFREMVSANTELCTASNLFAKCILGEIEACNARLCAVEAVIGHQKQEYCAKHRVALLLA